MPLEGQYFGSRALYARVGWRWHYQQQCRKNGPDHGLKSISREPWTMRITWPKAATDLLTANGNSILTSSAIAIQEAINVQNPPIRPLGNAEAEAHTAADQTPQDRAVAGVPAIATGNTTGDAAVQAAGLSPRAVDKARELADIKKDRIKQGLTVDGGERD